MTSKSSSAIKLEIGHVLFIDIVAYSKLRISEQSELLRTLNEIVSATKQFREAASENKLVRLPTGDGMALVFRNNLEAPAQCALEITRALKKYPNIQLRMGVHSGPVNEVADVNQRANVTGSGINIAQRVMDCGDAGHILISKHAAEDLEQYDHWEPYLHELGDCEVKHGVRVSIVNLYTDELGNGRTPEKFRVASATAGVKPTSARAKYFFIGAIAIGLIALGLFFFKMAGESLRGVRKNTVAERGRLGEASLPIAEKSIAVLPFESLSEDKANAYFAEGIQDEILTRLSKIAALKVISRTSTQKYKSAPDNLREIGRQLGVANLLEGSVQKAANAVHVNVQLIRAATDEHLWAESYNRKLDDIFGVEGEVAGAIADQLQAKLSGFEKQELAAKPTNNPDAYDAYLRGLALAERPDLARPDQLNAIESLETAVRLDPNFAAAWALLSRTHGGAFFNFDSSPARREAVHKTLENALHLQPDLVETQLALAYSHYFVERDYDKARKIFQEVHAKSPNNSAAPLALALISRRQARWDESFAHFKEAVELDPRNLKVLMWTSDTYAALRQFPMALKFIDRALDIAPADNGAIFRKASIYQALGQLDQADAVLGQMHVDAKDDSPTMAKADQLLLQHRYPAGIALMQSSLATLDPSQFVEHCEYSFFLGHFQRLAGDAASARSTYAQVREMLETALHQQPDNTAIIGALAQVCAVLGDKSAALKEAELAMEKLPASRDAFVGPSLEETLARVLARVGEKDRAVTTLQHLLTVPYNACITPALLRLDPDWDNLRGDPRFDKLCQEKQQ